MNKKNIAGAFQMEHFKHFYIKNEKLYYKRKSKSKDFLRKKFDTKKIQNITLIFFVSIIKKLFSGGA